MIDKDLNIKIAGFSSAKSKKELIDENFYSRYDKHFRAPELNIKGTFDSEKIDVFALAIVIFTL